MENVQETYHFPRSNQKVENINKLISSNKLNLIKKKKKKNSHQTKVQDQMASQVNSTKLSEKS